MNRQVQEMEQPITPPPAESDRPDPEVTAAQNAEEAVARRNFVVEGLAVVIGGIATLVPLGVGLFSFFDPLLRKQAAGGGAVKLPITTETLPDDGKPIVTSVVATREDAWTRYPQAEVGKVVLYKTNSGGSVSAEDIQCFNVKCPHLGCDVSWKPARREFVCPCHDSSFTLTGEPTNKIPPRSLDPLTVEIRNDNEIWVRFQNFRAGTHDRIPV